MLAPALPRGSRPRVVGQGAVEPTEPHRARTGADHRAQWVVAVEPPIGHQLESYAATQRRVSDLGLARPLQQRAGVGVDEFGIDELGVTVAVGRDVPFALHVHAPQRVAILADRTTCRIVLHPDVVETLRAPLQAPPYDGALGA